MTRKIVLFLVLAMCVLVAILVYTNMSVDEGFESLPDPAALMKHMRVLLDKYDKPDVWNHAAQVMDKDPGELARRQLGILNKI